MIPARLSKATKRNSETRLRRSPIPINPLRPRIGCNRSESAPAMGWTRAPASNPTNVNSPRSVACLVWLARAPTWRGNTSVLIPSSRALNASQKTLIPNSRRVCLPIDCRAYRLAVWLVRVLVADSSVMELGALTFAPGSTPTPRR